jgi:low-affinity ferrous iron transport protein
MLDQLLCRSCQHSPRHCTPRPRLGDLGSDRPCNVFRFELVTSDRNVQYAGLIGMNDGFVLRNVYNKIGGHEDEEFDYQIFDDMDMLAVVGVTELAELAEERAMDNSLSCRISVVMRNWCSHERTVVFGMVTILGLIIGSSAMRWSVTGRLLSNVPPSIIESFFTMILITGHNIGDAWRRVILHNICLRRLKLISCVDEVVKLEKP